MKDDRMRPVISTLEVGDSIRQSGRDWWLIWNVVIIVVGTCAAVHWFRLGEDGQFVPIMQQFVEFYSFQTEVLRGWVSVLPFVYVPRWLFDYLILGALFSLLSIRATGPTGPGEEWPGSGKVTDWAFHFALWPLIFFFYMTSIFRVWELVDRERLQFVRTSLLAFLLIAPVTSLLVLIRDLGFFWTAVG